MKKAVCPAGLAFAAAGLLIFGSLEARAAVPAGVYADGQDMGGLSTEEAKVRIEEYIAGMSSQTVTLSVAGNQAETTAAELGMAWENESEVEERLNGLQAGNIMTRFVREKQLSQKPEEIELSFCLDEGRVSAFVEEKCAPFLREAVDAAITRENGAFVVTPSQDGFAVDVKATSAALLEAMEKDLTKPVTVEASVTETRAEKTTEMLSQIQDVLGTYSTGFSVSNRSRATNVRVGAEKINGTVLMPGEVLSGYEKMNPFTTANGYAAAASYENGQVVDSIGGGVCQIATTLYNAALLAEMEITQRQNHSMIVTYVPPSNDAAIAGTYKDIKFKNPYDTPVYVEGRTDGGTLTFTIYGKETRPANRTLKYESETLSVTDPGEPILKTDPSLAPGARVREQSAHKGMKSRLWKVVYVDGRETERELLHTDTYNASKAVYRVGPEPVAAPPAETPPETEAYVPRGPGDMGPGA